MIPKTLSASSLQVANLCMDRWQAEYVNRASNFSNVAADTGTAVHGGLEMFVKAFFVDKTHDPSMGRIKQKELLVTFYQMSYVQTFNTSDMETPQYKDGYNLTMKWFERTDLTQKSMLGVESAELKETIKVPYNHPDGTTHEVNFNYIMDRVDQIDETTWEVVDYKTVRVPIQPDNLENKIQARAYALAVQIKHPEAQKIIVTFDLLRHQSVGLVFSRDDNINFWRFLCSETQRIVNTSEADIKPTLNPECGFCVKKFTCSLLQSNIKHGGIHAINISDMPKLLGHLKDQQKANKRIIDELEESLMRYAAESDQLQWTTEDGSIAVEIKAPRRRSFPADRAAEIMGADLFKQMGSMTLGNLEKIIEDQSLDATMRQRLKDLIAWDTGNLSVKITPAKKGI